MGDPNFDSLILYFIKPHQRCDSESSLPDHMRKHDRIRKETKYQWAEHDS